MSEESVDTISSLYAECTVLKERLFTVPQEDIRHLVQNGGRGWQRFAELTGWLDMMPIDGVFQMVSPNNDGAADDPEHAKYIASVIEMFRTRGCPNWAGAIGRAYEYVVNADSDTIRGMYPEDQIEFLTEEGSPLEDAAYVSVREAARNRVFIFVTPELDHVLMDFYKRAQPYDAELLYFEEEE